MSCSPSSTENADVDWRITDAASNGWDATYLAADFSKDVTNWRCRAVRPMSAVGSCFQPPSLYFCSKCRERANASACVPLTVLHALRPM